MDRKELANDLVNFLKSKIPAHNKVTIHGGSQIRIESEKEGIKNWSLFDLVKKFLKGKSLSAEKNELGFILDEFVITITTHSYKSLPLFMSVISIQQK